MISNNFIIEQIGKTAVIGTAIVFFVNITCFALAFVAADSEGQSDVLGLIAFCFGIVAVVDIAAGFILKKRLLKPLFITGDLPSKEFFSQTVMKTMIVLSAVCASPAIYGLATTLLGSTIEVMAGFSLVSLIGFTMLRLRPRDFKKLQQN
jgi:hypothetical protein